jgi:hypothetical protein
MHGIANVIIFDPSSIGGKSTNFLHKVNQHGTNFNKKKLGTKFHLDNVFTFVG